MRGISLFGVLALFLATPGASARSQQLQEEPMPSRYDYMYGTPAEATVDDILQMPESYSGRAVRTKGTLELSTRPQQGRVGSALRGNFGARLEIVPVNEVAYEWETEARQWYGQEVTITGVVGKGQDASGNLLILVQFWKYLGPPERETKAALLKASTLTLEGLVVKPGRHDGQIVRVVGKFRGHNLYGDLPVRSRRNSSDWVIKDDLFAVWVTGKKPKGPGFDLDAGLKRDTGKWLAIVGRPQTLGNITYLQALQVEVTTPPSPTAQVQPPPPPPERPKVAPVVVFSLPLDGDLEVPSDGRFQVQFSKDMNELSFSGRVILRYTGRTLPGDRGFDGAKLSYDGGRRTLTVDPGDVLRPGRQIDLIFLPGIVDIDGLPLAARPGTAVGNAAEVLHFRILPSALAGAGS